VSTREETSRVDRGDVPKGYVISYHEIRGYDSPDRWYSAATVRHRKIGEFGTYGEAVEACKKDVKSK
jgi:hypothetical protein